jgi:hypothetical protein
LNAARSGHARDLAIELELQLRKHRADGGQVARGRHGERACDRCLHRAPSAAVDAAPAGGEPQERASRVAWIGDPADQPAIGQPLQHARERAGVEVEETGQRSRRDPREAADHPYGKTLRPGDAQTCLHPLRGGLERVVEGPEQPYEFQDASQPARDHAGLEARKHAEVVVGHQ